jgi:predicted DNA-binding ribbon-helix-helix protein
MKHSIELNGHQTSVDVDPETWQAFVAIARERGTSITKQLQSLATPAAKLAPAIRLFVQQVKHGG